MAARFCTNCGAPTNAYGTCDRCAAAPQLQGTVPSPQAAPPPWQGAAPPWQATAPPQSRFSGQWNWGAFLLCPFWLMNHGNAGLGILYLVLSIVPGVNLLLLGMAIYFGIKGNDVALQKRAFASEAQFVAVQNAWRNWGFIIVGVGIVLTFFSAMMYAMLFAAGSHYHAVP